MRDNLNINRQRKNNTLQRLHNNNDTQTYSTTKILESIINKHGRCLHGDVLFHLYYSFIDIVISFQNVNTNPRIKDTNSDIHGKQ